MNQRTKTNLQECIDMMRNSCDDAQRELNRTSQFESDKVYKITSIMNIFTWAAANANVKLQNAVHALVQDYEN